MGKNTKARIIKAAIPAKTVVPDGLTLSRRICFRRRRAFIIHPALVFSFLFTLFGCGLGAWVFFLDSPAWLPALPMTFQRWVADPICLMIMALFQLALWYWLIQELGLWAHTRVFAALMDRMVIDDARRTIGLAGDWEAYPWRVKTANVLAGHDGSLDLAFFRHLGMGQFLPDVQSNLVRLGRDAVDLYHSRFSNDTYVLNFAIWALPILGFIGTIAGVARAVAGLEKMIGSQGAAASTDHIRLVLSGLSSAFDTTFIGLITAAVMTCLTILLVRRINNQLADELTILIVHLRGEEPDHV